MILSFLSRARLEAPATPFTADVLAPLRVRRVRISSTRRTSPYSCTRSSSSTLSSRWTTATTTERPLSQTTRSAHASASAAETVSFPCLLTSWVLPPSPPSSPRAFPAKPHCRSSVDYQWTVHQVMWVDPADPLSPRASSHNQTAAAMRTPWPPSSLAISSSRPKSRPGPFPQTSSRTGRRSSPRCSGRTSQTPALPSAPSRSSSRAQRSRTGSAGRRRRRPRGIPSSAGRTTSSRSSGSGPTTPSSRPPGAAWATSSSSSSASCSPRSSCSRTSPPG